MENLFAVIGDPIAHSMSPIMHNDLFSFYKIDAHYHPLRVQQEYLEDAIKGLKAIGISGFNVTVPHKTAIIPFLDQLDPLAKTIGAVNTVVNENGRLIGYNTDGSGFVRGLREKIVELLGKKVLIIGAGGAARAIYFSLASEGVSDIDIANRTIERAESLISTCPFSVRSHSLTMSEGEECANDYNIIIQTTSIGMSPQLEGIPFSAKNIKSGTIVSDIIYNPLETKFLREAKKKGAIVQNGLQMFVYQGALAFEKWTGMFPDTEMMKRNVMNQLGG